MSLSSTSVSVWRVHWAVWWKLRPETWPKRMDNIWLHQVRTTWSTWWPAGQENQLSEWLFPLQGWKHWEWKMPQLPEFNSSHSICICASLVRYQQMMQHLKNTMTVVVESLINKFEEDQLRKEELHREKQHGQSSSQYNDNCSDSDSSFNQVNCRGDTVVWWNLHSHRPQTDTCSFLMFSRVMRSSDKSSSKL